MISTFPLGSKFSVVFLKNLLQIIPSYSLNRWLEKGTIQPTNNYIVYFNKISLKNERYYFKLYPV